MNLLEQHKLDEMVESFGSELVLELLDRLLAMDITTIRQTVEQDDLASAELMLHRLNSDSGWLGAARLHQQAEQLEQQAAEGHSDGVRAGLDGLEELFAQTLPLLSQARGRLA
ncbi:MAG: Hpt domain-containing protein [Candidatus Eremiobacteraeota bacterium]|nr:Hpt domain-containing protein [Candidatus Eremiobacteraeota bacterium]